MNDRSEESTIAFLVRWFSQSPFLIGAACVLICLVIVLASILTQGPLSQAESDSANRNQESAPVVTTPVSPAPFRSSKPARPPAKPYAIKGDQLGVLTVDEFEEKYDKTVSTDSSLFSEPWHADAGIAVGIVVSTLAGVETGCSKYRFIDGKLYDITIPFKQSDFWRVKEAMVAKHGAPTSSEVEMYQNAFGAVFRREVLTWDNGVSSMTLYEKFGSLDGSSLVCQHTELNRLAWSRAPAPSTDDL